MLQGCYFGWVGGGLGLSLLSTAALNVGFADVEDMEMRRGSISIMEEQ